MSTTQHTDTAISSGRVVLVSDDDVGSGLARLVATAGYEVATVPCSTAALTMVDSTRPDVVMVSDIDASDCVRFTTLVRTTYGNPVIVVSTDASDGAKVAALDAGADDYVTAPFSVSELLARLRVAMRRRGRLPVVEDNAIELGDLVISPSAHVAVAGGRTMPLANSEFVLLVVLARSAGGVVTYAALRAALGEPALSIGAIRARVNKLRAKLGAGPARPQIVTASRIGYQLRVPPHISPLNPA